MGIAVELIERESGIKNGRKIYTAGSRFAGHRLKVSLLVGITMTHPALRL